MARKKKDGVFATFYLEKKLVEKLDKFCEETGLSKTKALENMIRDYLEKNCEKEN